MRPINAPAFSAGAPPLMPELYLEAVASHAAQAGHDAAADIGIYTNLSTCFRLLGRLDDALSWAHKADRLERTADSLVNLAGLHLLRGEFRQAIAYAENAL